MSASVSTPYHVRVIDDSNACYSLVGMRTDIYGGQGYQVLNTYSSCGVAATTHEFLHAAGMWHEQSRTDRDTYVQIVEAKILPDKLHNFAKVYNSVSVGSYDFDSIMHYPFWAFNVDGNNSTETIISKIAGSPVTFYNYVISSGDRATINSIYPSLNPPSGDVVMPPILQLLLF